MGTYSSYTKLLCLIIVWVIKIVKHLVYIKRKQVCTESKQLFIRGFKGSRTFTNTNSTEGYSREYNVLKESKELPTNNNLLSFRTTIKNNLRRIAPNL